MKDVKRIFLDVSIYDYPAVQQKLTDMAAQGWHLEKSGLLGLWTFRRGDPKQVRYEIIYAPKASAFNSRPTDDEEDLADLCAQAGWEWVTAQAQMQIYRNDNPNATPLETDEQERLKNIRRTMKKHFFPQYILMMVLFLLQFAMHFSTFLNHPSRTASSGLMFIVLTSMPLLSLIYAVMLADGWLWLRRADRAVSEGLGIPANDFYRKFRWVVWTFCAAMLAGLFGLDDLNAAGAILSISILAIGSTLLTLMICKQLNAPKWVNIVLPMAVTMVSMTFFMTLFVMGQEYDETPYGDQLPLTLQDLGFEETTDRTVLEESASPVAAYGRYWDQGEEIQLNYTIVDTEWDWIWEKCQAEQEQQFMQASLYSYLPIDGELRALFGAEYVRHSMNNTGDRWLICWDDRIVSLRASWELTEEQISIIVAQLKP